MANKRFAAVVRAQIAEAMAAGRQAADRPRAVPADDGGAYLAPQILVNVDHSMRVMMEESFGPVVGIMKVKDDAEAIAPDERQPLWPDRQHLDAGLRHRRQPLARRSKPAPSS